MHAKSIRAHARRVRNSRTYRKSSDRIKQGSKGAFSIDGHTEHLFEDGKCVGIVVYDLDGEVVGKKKRRKRKPKANKPRTMLRKAKW